MISWEVASQRARDEIRCTSSEGEPKVEVHFLRSTARPDIILILGFTDSIRFGRGTQITGRTAGCFDIKYSFNITYHLLPLPLPHPSTHPRPHLIRIDIYSHSLEPRIMYHRPSTPYSGERWQPNSYIDSSTCENTTSVYPHRPNHVGKRDVLVRHELLDRSRSSTGRSSSSSGELPIKLSKLVSDA